MKKIHVVILLVSIIIVILILAISKEGFFDIWGIGTFLLMLVVLGLMFYQFERGKITSKEISLIAILSGISAISRIPFAAIPGIQPSTFIIICTGFVFGPIAGFMVGATTALVSNIFLGQGPWTIFQMFAWGLVGMTSSVLSKFKIHVTGLVLFGVIWGYLFGWIMNLWFWIAYIYPHNFSTFIFYMSTSIGFDTLHALGNAIFLILLGEKTIKIFQRYKNRFNIKYRPDIEISIKIGDSRRDAIKT